MRLYLDANVIIYLVEGSDGLRNSVLSWTDQAEAQPDRIEPAAPWSGRVPVV